MFLHFQARHVTNRRVNQAPSSGRIQARKAYLQLISADILKIPPVMKRIYGAIWWFFVNQNMIISPQFANMFLKTWIK